MPGRKCRTELIEDDIKAELIVWDRPDLSPLILQRAAALFVCAMHDHVSPATETLFFQVLERAARRTVETSPPVR